MAKVSIIVSSHNGEEKIEKCIKSLINQKLEDIEIILIDDASVDRTLTIMKNYEQIFPNIKVFHNDVNKGQGFSRNLGLSVATGEYIGFVDSDDYISINMYKSMYESAKKNNFPDIVNTMMVLAKTDSSLMYDFNNSSIFNESLMETNKNKKLFYSFSPSCCNKIFKKELISDYKFLENSMWEDVAFTFSMLIKSKSVLDVDRNNYFYSKDDKENVSSKGSKYNPNILDIIKVCDEIENFAKANNLYDEYRNEIKFVQISSVISRINEVRNWEIDSNSRKIIIDNLYNLMVSKYGYMDEIDKSLLSSKVGFDVLDYLELHESNKDRDVKVK